MLRTMPNPPRKSGRPAQSIPRQTLLARARDCFAEFGYTGASMNTIAQRIGIRKASLFHHFASKEALYIEVLATAVTELGAYVQGAGLEDAPFEERLDRLGDLSEDYLSAHPTTSRLLVWEVLGQGPFMQGPAGDAVPQTIREVARLLEEGMDSGAIPHQDPLHLAMSITSIHILHFAVSSVTSSLFDEDIFSSTSVKTRKAAVREQVRRLCGLAVSSS